MCRSQRREYFQRSTLFRYSRRVPRARTNSGSSHCRRGSDRCYAALPRRGAASPRPTFERMVAIQARRATGVRRRIAARGGRSCLFRIVDVSRNGARCWETCFPDRTYVKAFAACCPAPPIALAPGCLSITSCRLAKCTARAPEERRPVKQLQSAGEPPEWKYLIDRSRNYRGATTWLRWLSRS